MSSLGVSFVLTGSILCSSKSHFVDVFPGNLICPPWESRVIPQRQDNHIYKQDLTTQSSK